MSRRPKKKARPEKAAAMPSGTPVTEDSPALESASRPAGLSDRWTVLWVCILLAAMTWLVFGQTLEHEFVNYDDELYVADNPAVPGGLSLKGIVWAFTHNVNVNWTPLTVISHMLDCQFYGLYAGGHHLTNLLLHAATTILLFLVLRQMTAALWPSAFVAAVFAVHPLHVESVAWIAERRDVFSGLFFMLTLGAYAGYARHRWSLGRYLMVVLMLALALMSKPMVVTLPFVLLLLDYWPLKRFPQPGDRLIPWRLIVEKVPLLALSGAACVATLFAQKEAIQSVPLSLRIGNALVSYVAYLGQMIYPVGLAVFYPYPGNGLALWKMIAAFVLLLVISAGAVAIRRKQPWFLFGWLWYLGMLVPAIGLIQSGLRARADRYTYLPQIGLYVLLTWAAVELCAGWRHRRVMLGGCITIILVALIFCARVQTSYWQNSESLWTHTLACTSDNAVAHNNFGVTLLQKGKVNEAFTHYQKALQINPGYVEAHINFGNALLQKGNVDEAITHYQKALQINPGCADAHINLGNVLLKKGSVDEAIAHYQKALEIKPDYAEVHLNLGSALIKKGSMDEAIDHYQKALEIKPDYAEAHLNLGSALLKKGSVDEAIVHYQKALQIKPDYAKAHIDLGNALLKKGSVEKAITHYQKALQIKPENTEAQNNLAWVLATALQASLRNGRQAVELAQQANQLAGGENPIILRTLAAAYAEAGRFSDAQRSAQKTMALARAAGQSNLVEQLNGELKLYTAGLPFHQESK
jgi:tetratricopeptide (TPR) repeat protein